jgi:hypothetical protein
VLPANDINGKGRVVNEVSGDWVDLSASEKYSLNKTFNLALNPEGKFTGNVIEKFDGYAGINRRNNINTEKSLDDYFRKLQENTVGLAINKYSVADLRGIYKPLTDTLNVDISDMTETIGDKILFSQLLYEKIEKNYYTLEDRKYPVNYNFPVSETLTFNYVLPEGYKVESMPEAATLKLPDNSIVFSYKTSCTGNKLLVEYKRDINKILFLPEDYSMLKTLYDQLVKKHGEQVILKKSV